MNPPIDEDSNQQDKSPWSINIAFDRRELI